MRNKPRQRSTFSMWSDFSHCERKVYWRYIREQVPVQLDAALTFGSLIHECLATWYKTGNSDSVLALIDDNYVNRFNDVQARKHWHYAHAMIAAYMKRLAPEAWNIRAVEFEFSIPLINPATGRPSRTFTLNGKVDLIVEQRGQLFVIEHKTAAIIDAAYIEGLNLSLQADIYSFVIGESAKRPAGVIYNLLKKPLLKQYEANSRRAEPETDEAFRARLCESLSGPESFQRFQFLYDASDRRRLQTELWELSQRWLRCKKTGMWLQNRQACFRFNKPCRYFKLCTSRDSEDVLGEFYEYQRAHSELSEPKEPPNGTTD